MAPKPTKFDILTFGSVTYDIILRLKDGASIDLVQLQNEYSLTIPLGDKIPVEELITTCGGGAANSAVGFTKQGFSTAAVGVLGDDVNKFFITSVLENQGVNTDHIITETGENCSLSVVLSDWTGKRTVLHKRLKSKCFNAEIVDKLPESKAFYIGHLQQNANEIIHALAARFTDEERLIGWNPGKTQFAHGFEAYHDVYPLIDVLILNVEEARDFTGLDFKVFPFEEATPGIYGEEICCYQKHIPEFITDVRHLAEKFLNAGVEVVCITDGSRGAQIFDGTNHYWAAPVAVERKDTLGAGDAFSIGVLSARLKEKTLNKQILWGSLNSASVIQHYGAQAGQLTEDQMPND